MVDAEVAVIKTGISLGVKALVRMDWFGKLVLDYRDLVSQKKFVESIQANVKDNKLHVPIKIRGTITGRCSSGNLEGDR